MSKEFCQTINNPEEFLKFIENPISQKEKIQNLLLGNGFGLSHPVLKDCFKWDMHSALCSEWNKIIPNVSKNCPEADLSQIRLNVLKKILAYYIDKMDAKLNKENPEKQNLNGLREGYNKNKYSCAEFLKKFTNGNIFTVNYDPIMYFEILKLLEDKGINFFDGFISGNDNGNDGCAKKYPNGENEGYLDPKYIACKLCKADNVTKIYYLHGSWFIQHRQEDNFLKKLSFSKSNQWTIEDLFNKGVSPYIILEDRWRVKEALIQSDRNPYLRFCYKQLENQTGNLLVFGVSFNNDEHILHALNNSQYAEIYITCRDNENKKKIEEKIAKLDLEKLKCSEYIKISDNVIWKKLSP